MRKCNCSWMPDAIVFNSWQHYGTHSYWMQTFFRESSGDVIHPFNPYCTRVSVLIGSGGSSVCLLGRGGGPGCWYDCRGR